MTELERRAADGFHGCWNVELWCYLDVLDISVSGYKYLCVSKSTTTYSLYSTLSSHLEYRTLQSSVVVTWELLFPSRGIPGCTRYLRTLVTESDRRGGWSVACSPKADLCTMLDRVNGPLVTSLKYDGTS